MGGRICKGTTGETSATCDSKSAVERLVSRCLLCGREYDAAKNFDWIINSKYCSIACNFDHVTARTIFDVHAIKTRLAKREIDRLEKKLAGFSG